MDTTIEFTKSLNAWKTNEFSINVDTYEPKFSFATQKSTQITSAFNLNALSSVESCKILPGKSINFDTLSKFDDVKKLPPNCVEQINSYEWLAKYGLNVNKLKLEQILAQIGFKQAENYLTNLNKAISSKYSAGLYLQTATTSGIIYNITCNQGKLLDFIARLEDAINLYKKRLQWLNSDSRRIFGLLSDKNIVLVLDTRQKDQFEFDQFKACLAQLLREQVSCLNKFNIIRCSNEIEIFKDSLVTISPEVIDEAISWLNTWSLPSTIVSSLTLTCEACLKGFSIEGNVDAVHLITDDQASSSSREILLDKIAKESHTKGTKLNISSYNCIDLSTVEFLRRLATSSQGTYHAYCFLRAANDYLPGSIDRDPTKNQIIANKRLFGGTPQGAGVKHELMIIFDELQQAHECLEHLKTLLDYMGNQKKSITTSTIQSTRDFPQAKEESNDEYISSKDWLRINGLRSKKLELFDVLADNAFKHCDGLVELKEAPVTGGVGDAVSRQKLINAKYCDQFAHVLWNDGTIRHVHVTPEMHRLYEKKMRCVLDLLERRIEWLSKGSRELFGTVIESSICILIDISHSMQHSLEFVKQKLLVLLQEQLKSKQKFNIIAFNDKVQPWRDRMCEVNEANFDDAWRFIKSFQASGTTNTLGALKFALADLSTEAIYLLTDGRPNQTPKQILSQVTLNNKCPIHVISFNCNDKEANRFLAQLARDTCGRYHYFNDSNSAWNADPEGPVPYESEDVRLIKDELSKGVKYLKQIENLRNECSKLSYLERKKLLSPKCSKDHSKLPTKQLPKSPEELDLIQNFNKVFKSKSPIVGESLLEKKLNAFQSDSILNTLNGTNDWVLRETRDMLERQQKRQIEVKSSKQKPPEAPKRSFSASTKPHEQTPKQWLHANSLKTLKLTILDVLGPTLVKKKSNYIQIKGESKKIESKVWNNITSLALTTSNKQHTTQQLDSEFCIVNAQSIDLEEFERKLKKQINIYQEYLSEKLQALAEGKESIHFNEENYYLCYKLVEEKSQTSILSTFDLNAFKREIELAYKYIQQSEDIRKSVKNKEDILNKEIKVDSLKKNQEKTLPKMTNDTSLQGEKVLARHDMHGYYYEALVIQQNDPRHVTVKFSNGVIQDNLPVLFIIQHKKITSRPSLDMGDYVMAHVKNEFNYECFVPGIVQYVDPTSQPKQHRVMYFNGNEGIHLRQELIQINKNRYGLSSNYIRNKLGMSNKLSPLNDLPSDSPKSVTKSDDKSLQTAKINLESFKNEIIVSIIDHFNKLNLDEKYQRMHQELIEAKEAQKRYKNEFKKKLKVLKKDLQSNKQSIQNNFQVDLATAAPLPTPVAKDVLPLEKPKQLSKKLSSINEELHAMRKNLTDLTVGEEVLAKWVDDGWYYRSTVVNQCSNDKYIIEDINKTQETVLREDIISESDVANAQLCLHDPVVALHPAYSYSYAPGLIVRITNHTSLLIRFYDGVEGTVNKEEVYKIALFKFEYDVEQIIQYEKRWIGETVVARNSLNCVYQLGRVKERIGNGRQYAIQWSDSKITIETATHIFGRYTYQPPININDFVLASNDGIYLPGKVIGTKGESFMVRFVDGNTNDHVQSTECYWISRLYYEDAFDFFRRKSKIVLCH